MELVLKQTGDGSYTFFLPGINEQYHSLNGAVTESEHVFLKMGFQYHPSNCPVVFEIGFGTGLNAFLTARLSTVTRRSVYYIALEKYPLQTTQLQELDYGKYGLAGGNELYASMHECSWNDPVQLTPYFRLLKLNSDLTSTGWEIPCKCHVVYFDAFGPDKQPEMWTREIFTRIYENMMPGGILVTYSAKGEVRRRLNAAGFKTEKLPGPPGKKEMLRAIK